MSLTDRAALVTGASRGIGRAVALALAEAGADVAINYRSREDAAGEVAAAVQRLGRRALLVPADVSDFEQVSSAVERTLAEFGHLDVLVNNAGISKDALIYDMNPDDWLEVMKVNFGGVFNCTKAVMGHFMSQGSGSIVNVSSVMAERGWIGEANYAASKAAINALTRCAAVELARFGIRVNAVLPGFVQTEMVDAVMASGGAKGILAQIPMRAFAGPEEVARVVVFLASPEAATMTGSLVTIDGGSSVQLGVGRPLTR